MLMPRKTRHRKQQRGRNKGDAKGGTTLNFGDFGIQALEPGWLTARQIEAARIAMTRHVRRGGMLFELGGVDVVLARSAMERAIQKLPIKAKFVVRPGTHGVSEVTV